MTVIAFASGTQTATIGTEHVLSNVNAQGRFELVIDLSVLAANDVVELRAYSEVLGAGTAKVAAFYQFQGVQPTDATVFISDMVDNDLADAVSLKWTLKQTFGTGRAFPWKVLNLTGEPANFSLLDINASGQVNVGKWLSSAVSALTVGIPDVNVKNFNNVAAQTDANNLPKVDTEDWKATPVAGAIPPDVIFIRSWTAQAGSLTSITLDAGASAVNDFYKNEVVFIRSGTGAGQAAIITAYNGTTKVATVGGFAVAPDATSVFTVAAFGPGAASVTGTVLANVTQWNGSAVATPAVAGVPIVDLKYILGSILTEGVTGRLAAGFKEFLDVASQVFNLGSVNQTGDAFARLGAPVGASISADIAGVPAKVWDEILTAATHNIATSAGRRLRTLSQIVVFDGLVQSATATTITFQTGPTATNDVYIGDTVVLTSGSGAGQARIIVDWNGATLTATLNTPLTTIPALNDTVQIQASDTQAVTAHGAVTGVPTTTTVPLEASASAVANIYVGQTLLIQNAAGPEAEARVISSYNGTTKTATVTPALNRTPVAGDAYSIWNTGRAMVDVANVATDSPGVTTLLTRLTQAILFDASGNVKADVETWKAAVVNALIAGRVDADTEAIGSGVLTSVAAAVWNALTSGMSTAGSIGLLLATDVNATISSRSTLTAQNVWDALTVNLTTVGSIGLLLSQFRFTIANQVDANALTGGGGATPAQIWDYLTSNIVTAGSIGVMLKNVFAILGAFTGTGSSTIFAWLQAMMRDDVTAPPDIGGTYSPGLDSLQAIAIGGGGGGGLTAAQVWGYASRTLTQLGASVVAALAGKTITMYNRVTLNATLTGLNIPATWTKVYLTVKRSIYEIDTQAAVQVVVSNPAAPTTDGITVLLGATPSAAQRLFGSVTVNQGAGTVAILLKADLDFSSVNYQTYYDVKAVLSDGSTVLLASSANFNIYQTETGAIA